MSNYLALDNCFSNFDNRAENEVGASLQHFISYLSYNAINITWLRSDIQDAIQDKNFDWLSIAKEHYFVGCNESSTNESVFFYFKLLVWKIVFFEEDSKIDYAVFLENKKILQTLLIEEKKLKVDMKGFIDLSYFDFDKRYEIVRSFQKYDTIWIDLYNDVSMIKFKFLTLFK